MIYIAPSRPFCSYLSTKLNPIQRDMGARLYKWVEYGDDLRVSSHTLSPNHPSQRLIAQMTPRLQKAVVLCSPV